MKAIYEWDKLAKQGGRILGCLGVQLEMEQQGGDGQGHAEYVGLDDVVGDNRQEDVDFFRPNSSMCLYLSLLDYSYAVVWDMSFQVVAAMFKKLGPYNLNKLSYIIMSHTFFHLKLWDWSLEPVAQLPPISYVPEAITQVPQESYNNKKVEVSLTHVRSTHASLPPPTSVDHHPQHPTEGSGKIIRINPGSGYTDTISMCRQSTSVTDERLQDVSRKKNQPRGKSLSGIGESLIFAGISMVDRSISSKSRDLEIPVPPLTLAPLFTTGHEIVSNSAPTTGGALIIIDDDGPDMHYMFECYFDQLDVICWKNLRSLSIAYGCLDEDLFQNILSGSPFLGTLVLEACCGIEQLDITNESVNNLVIFDVSKDIDSLKISAPYILSFAIKDDFSLMDILLLNMSSLIKAELD
ncbi:hypothetical protein Tco_0698124 [Tanacetum coccineum]